MTFTNTGARRGPVPRRAHGAPRRGRGPGPKAVPRQDATRPEEALYDTPEIPVIVLTCESANVRWKIKRSALSCKQQIVGSNPTASSKDAAGQSSMGDRQSAVRGPLTREGAHITQIGGSKGANTIGAGSALGSSRLDWISRQWSPVRGGGTLVVGNDGRRRTLFRSRDALPDTPQQAALSQRAARSLLPLGMTWFARTTVPFLRD